MTPSKFEQGRIELSAALLDSIRDGVPPVIRTREAYAYALDWLDRRFEHEPTHGTVEATAFRLMVGAVEAFEAQHYPMESRH